MTIDVALPVLRCPIDQESLHQAASTLRCASGHVFDIARQGYVNLLAGSSKHTGDTAAMVADRGQFLEAGHYALFADAIAAAATTYAPPGPVLDLAGGTGWYLARILAGDPDRTGVVVEVSVPALRRAARINPRIAAVGADVWAPLPIAAGAVAMALSIFGPRSPQEIVRVLRPGGIAIVLAAAPDHLVELRQPLGLLDVPTDKVARQRDAFASFDLIETRELRRVMTLNHAAISALIGMGPSAFHIDTAERARRVAALAEPVDVTAAAVLQVFRSRV